MSTRTFVPRLMICKSHLSSVPETSWLNAIVIFLRAGRALHEAEASAGVVHRRVDRVLAAPARAGLLAELRHECTELAAAAEGLVVRLDRALRREVPGLGVLAGLVDVAAPLVPVDDVLARLERPAAAADVVAVPGPALEIRIHALAVADQLVGERLLEVVLLDADVVVRVVASAAGDEPLRGAEGLGPAVHDVARDGEVI